MGYVQVNLLAYLPRHYPHPSLRIVRSNWILPHNQHSYVIPSEVEGPLMFTVTSRKQARSFEFAQDDNIVVFLGRKGNRIVRPPGVNAPKAYRQTISTGHLGSAFRNDRP